MSGIRLTKQEQRELFGEGFSDEYAAEAEERWGQTEAWRQLTGRRPMPNLSRYMKVDRVKGHLDLVLLGMLAGGPAHGYALISAMKERTQGVLDIPEGSVYPALHRMEDLGLVESEWVTLAGRRRRQYRLTPRGAEALSVERRDWRTLVAAIDAAIWQGQPARGMA